MELIFELSRSGRKGYRLPALDVEETELSETVPSEYLREDLNLPELSELDVVRHFTRLSQLNYAVDTTMVPLGSCTMKYNPRIGEEISTNPREVSLQPAAGAQGELLGLLLISAYHRDRGNHRKNKILIPDSAHGTNPASAALCGFRVVTVRSDRRGQRIQGGYGKERQKRSA